MGHLIIIKHLSSLVSLIFASVFYSIFDGVDIAYTSQAFLILFVILIWLPEIWFSFSSSLRKRVMDTCSELPGLKEFISIYLPVWCARSILFVALVLPEANDIVYYGLILVGLGANAKGILGRVMK